MLLRVSRAGRSPLASIKSTLSLYFSIKTLNIRFVFLLLSEHFCLKLLTFQCHLQACWLVYKLYKLLIIYDSKSSVRIKLTENRTTIKHYGTDARHDLSIHLAMLQIDTC